MKNYKKLITIIALVLVSILLISGVLYSVLVFSLTPESIRSPEYAHHHFRMQLFVDGQWMDFSEDRFQEGYDDAICSAGLTNTPIHFHDNVDQYVHIHWAGISGGQVLKYFGFNSIGGLDDTLGWQTNNGDQFLKRVKIHGDLIPDNNEKMWLYEGTEENWKKREAEDFLNQDLETFFGKKSSLTIQREEAEADKNSFIPNLLSLKTKAHGSDKEHSEEELKEIENILGNVVIFVQNEEPESNLIQERFNNLVEIEKSSCGG